MDADFNVIYESAEVPLSAFGLVHDGERLQREGRLVMRPIAPPKPSLPSKDLLPFYAYVHVHPPAGYPRAIPGVPARTVLQLRATATFTLPADSSARVLGDAFLERVFPRTDRARTVTVTARFRFGRAASQDANPNIGGILLRSPRRAER